jgi:hypothetical protein
MAAFVKFDPWAAIAAAKQRPAQSRPDEGHKPETFATFAGFALRHPENENLESTASLGNKNQISPVATAKAAKTAKAVPGGPFPFAGDLDHLERRCPDYVEAERWRQCVEDARRFLASWGDQALALGWAASELFGLHAPPANPHPSYSRLSRYDCTGLLWLLQGRRVVALTADTAAIQNPSTRNVLAYRKLRKPALGPLGDSLDDFTT